LTEQGWRYLMRLASLEYPTTSYLFNFEMVECPFSLIQNLEYIGK
jgi:hypothetical protein